VTRIEAKPASAVVASQDAQQPTATARQGASISKRTKLAVLATTLSGLPPVAQPYVHGLAIRAGKVPHAPGPRLAFAPAPWAQSPAGSSLQRPGPLFADQGGKNQGKDGGIEHGDDFGGQWVGGLPDSSAGDPGAFLARFRSAEDGKFSDIALQAYGHAQAIDTGLAELKSASVQQAGYLGRLTALASRGVDLLRLLGASPRGGQGLPALSAVDASTLTQLDGLLKTSGQGEPRENFLQGVARACFDAGEISNRDSAAGKMLAHLSDSVMREISHSIAGPDGPSPAAGASTRSALMAILERYQKMLEKHAGLETLGGNHAQAAALLQTCVDTVPAAKRMLHPEHAASDHLALTFRLLQSQILARDDEAVGTLETLYMAMQAHAEEHPRRFPADFPQAAFVRRLEDAYDTFLAALENEGLQASLEHPIARLFVEAEQRGIFDDDGPDGAGGGGGRKR
jgi:hypothetical protein